MPGASRSLFQPEKQTARGRREGDGVRAVAGGEAAARAPTGQRRRQVAALNKVPTGPSLPEHRNRITSVAEVKRRGTRRLHHVHQRPEAARQRIIPAGHCAARIRLADGAADLISPAGAGAAAGDFIPVNRVSLGANGDCDGEKCQQCAENPPGFGLRQPSGAL